LALRLLAQHINNKEFYYYYYYYLRNVVSLCENAGVEKEDGGKAEDRRTGGAVDCVTTRP
jgi:hypothetical protein